jgi:PPOX class probable F420-dependent enzyme
MLEPAIRDLARTGKNFGTLAVQLPNGQIASHVMWVDADDEHVLINTEVHRQKYKNVDRDPRVTVTVWNAANPYQYVEVRGTVTAEVRGDEARAHIDACAKRYMGVDDYPNPIQSERVILRITPERTNKAGF